MLDLWIRQIIKEEIKTFKYTKVVETVFNRFQKQLGIPKDFLKSIKIYTTKNMPISYKTEIDKKFKTIPPALCIPKDNSIILNLDSLTTANNSLLKGIGHEIGHLVDINLGTQITGDRSFSESISFSFDKTFLKNAKNFKEPIKRDIPEKEEIAEIFQKIAVNEKLTIKEEKFVNEVKKLIRKNS